MTLSQTQKGMIGEQLVCAVSTLLSDGELELFRPVSDDDHTDIVAGRKRSLPALALQVKTALRPTRRGYVAMQATYYDGKVVEHPAFYYVVVLLEGLQIGCCWLIPSHDFNLHASRDVAKRGGIQLVFMATPAGNDKWAPYRLEVPELGTRLLALVDQAALRPPPWLYGLTLLRA